MKALGIQQPWAFAIVRGPKRIENRMWGEGYTGPLLIHASKSLSRDTAELRAWFARTVPGLVRVLPAKGEYPLGCIVGACYVKVCTRSSGYAIGCTDRPRESCGIAGQEVFCDSAPRTVFWALRDVVAFDAPVPWRGERKLFEVPLRAVEAQLEAARWTWLDRVRADEGAKK